LVEGLALLVAKVAKLYEVILIKNRVSKSIINQHKHSKTLSKHKHNARYDNIFSPNLNLEAKQRLVQTEWRLHPTLQH
jgi:hypothetical protein